MDPQVKEDLRLQKEYSEKLTELKESGVDLWAEGKKFFLELIKRELVPKKVVKGFFTCGICKLKNTYSFEIQDRAGDEGASFYIFCDTPNCKGKTGWKQ